MKTDFDKTWDTVSTSAWFQARAHLIQQVEPPATLGPHSTWSALLNQIWNPVGQQVLMQAENDILDREYQ